MTTRSFGFGGGDDSDRVGGDGEDGLQGGARLDLETATAEQLLQHLIDTNFDLKCRSNDDTPRTVTIVIHEWYVIGKFEGKPIRGGIDALAKRFEEAKVHPLWRDQYYNNSISVAFTRMRKIVEGVRKDHCDGKSIDDVLSEWDSIVRGKRGLTALVKALVDTGKLANQKQREGDHWTIN